MNDQVRDEFHRVIEDSEATVEGDGLRDCLREMGRYGIEAGKGSLLLQDRGFLRCARLRYRNLREKTEYDTVYGDGRKEYAAVQIPWEKVTEILGRRHGGTAEDDAVLRERLLRSGAPAWVKDAHGWIGEGGWGLIGPEKEVLAEKEGEHFPGKAGTGERFDACVEKFVKDPDFKPRHAGDTKEAAAERLCAYIGRRAGKI